MVQTDNKNAYFKPLQNSLAILFSFLISNSRRLNRKQRQRIWFLPERELFFFFCSFYLLKQNTATGISRIKCKQRGDVRVPESCRCGREWGQVGEEEGGGSLSGAAAGPEATLQVLAAAGRV